MLRFPRTPSDKLQLLPPFLRNPVCPLLQGELLLHHLKACALTTCLRFLQFRKRRISPSKAQWTHLIRWLWSSFSVWPTDHRRGRVSECSFADFSHTHPGTLDKGPGNLRFNRLPKILMDGTILTPEFLCGNLYVQDD